MSGERPAALDLSPFRRDVMLCSEAGWRATSATLQTLQTPPSALNAASRRSPSRSTPTGRVAVIPVRGFLVDHGGWVSEILGWSTYDGIGGAVDAAAGDDTVDAILLDCDSPGGSVAGALECADRVYTAAQVKTVVAFSNALCASAAYWICSQAGRFLAMPSAETGSVGVLAVHADYSRQNDAEGVTVTHVYAGQHKVEFSPDLSLSATARDFLQARVNEIYGQFVGAVARGRRTTPARVESDFGQGRVLSSRAAKAVGMICDTSPTLLTAIGRAAAGDGAPRGDGKRSAAAGTMTTAEARAAVSALAAEPAGPTSLRAARQRIAALEGK